MNDVKMQIWQSRVRLYAVTFPTANTSSLQPFWTHTGTGISSRLAEDCLGDDLYLVPDDGLQPQVPPSTSHALVQKRIASLLNRCQAETIVTPSDVYLFPTGMAAVYALHTMLLDIHHGFTVLLGFVFKSSHFLFENFGPGCKVLGLGSTKEVSELEEYLESCGASAPVHQVQALWTEFPANPLLTSAHLKELRRLANKHDLVLIVDDTIGSFSNVDVLAVADVIITSLTKSFSGYADVMGGSIVLNPNSIKYKKIKSMFEGVYRNDYWGRDVEVLETNSRDYLDRSKISNNNAEQLVAYLQQCASCPDSTVTQVFYPTVNADREHYESFMRPATEVFSPGYGCLFTVEFDRVEATIAFYDALNVYKGPHLGAHLTLAMAYVKGLYGKQLDWVSQFGLRETQIRVSVGLEDTERLLETFKLALKAADDTTHRIDLLT